VRNTELRCHCWRIGFQINFCAKHGFALSLVLQRLSITLVVRSKDLRCHWCSNGFQLHLCEAYNCVVRGRATALNYISCAKHRIAFSLVEHRLSITFVVQNTIALSLVLQKFSITFVVRNRERHCHWWSNSS